MKDNIIYIAAKVDAHKKQADYDFIEKFVKIDKHDIDIGDSIVSPFLLTCKLNNNKVGLELLKYGAKINSIEKDTKNTCIHILTEKNNYGYLNLLLQFIHKRSNDNNDPIQYSVGLNLLRAKNKDAITALEIANYNGYKKISNLLLKSIKKEEEIIKFKKNLDILRKNNKDGFPFENVNRLPNKIAKLLKEENEIRKKAENDKINEYKEFQDSISEASSFSDMPPET